MHAAALGGLDIWAIFYRAGSDAVWHQHRCRRVCVLLAQYSSHYVGMLLKLLPLFAVLRLLGGYLFQTPFFFRAGVDKLHEIPGLEGWIAVGLLVLALGLCLFAARHQRQKE